MIGASLKALSPTLSQRERESKQLATNFSLSSKFDKLKVVGHQIAAQMGNRSYTNVETRETRYKMVEEFSFFKSEGGLNLPHIYTIKLSVDAQGGTFLADWIIKLTQFSFNEKIDPNSFSISVN